MRPMTFLIVAATLLGPSAPLLADTPDIKYHEGCRLIPNLPADANTPQDQRSRMVPLVPLPVATRYTPPRDRSRKEPPPPVTMRLLLLSATEDDRVEPSLAIARQSLRSMGIPFDHLPLTKNGKRLSESPLALESPLGGRYYGFVLTSGQLAFQDSDGQWQSALTTPQWLGLDDYERRFGTRRVALSVFPMAFLGVEPILPGDSEPDFMRYANAAKPYATGMRTDAVLPLQYSWHYPARLTDPTIARSFLTFDSPAADGTPRPQAAVVSTLPDGREQLSFFFVPSTFSVASIVLAQTWINWVTRGLYLGDRRIYVEIHVDDFFSFTELWNTNPAHTGTDGFERRFRLPVDDFKLFLDWQRDVAARFDIRGFKTDLIVNGFDVLHPDGGFARDSLFVAARRNRQAFFWTNHTFTHANLDNYTFNKTNWEVQANREFIRDLLENDTEGFSPGALVTPQISGLFNKEALRSLYVNGYRVVIGDNTRPELRPFNNYDARYTNNSLNGFDGIMIIPRQATQVYFNASVPAELESEYNQRYRSYWGRDITLTELLDLEAKRVANFLLALRHDPYMFHQANLRAFRWPTSSSSQFATLLGLWLEAVLAETRLYTDLPFLSVKFDQLADVYRSRMRTAACGIEARIIPNADGARSLELLAASACVARVTGARLESSPNARVESYGPDITTSVDLLPGKPVQFILPADDR